MGRDFICAATSRGSSRPQSTQKWLEVHGLEHWTHFYTPYGVDLQKRFFDHFLWGLDNGWDDQPRVLLQVRHIDPGDKGSIAGRFVERAENAWPLERTEWTRYDLHAADTTLRIEPAGAVASAEYDATGSGVTFASPLFDEDTEITGPLAAKLFVSSSTTDADLFLVLSVFDAFGAEVAFRGAMDAHTPIAQGWLRASHRRVDPKRSRTVPALPHRTPRRQPLEPGSSLRVGRRDLVDSCRGAGWLPHRADRPR